MSIRKQPSFMFDTRGACSHFPRCEGGRGGGGAGGGQRSHRRGQGSEHRTVFFTLDPADRHSQNFGPETQGELNVAF